MILYLRLKQEGYIQNLNQFKRLTLAQIRLFIKTSKKIEDLERLNEKIKQDLKSRNKTIKMK